MNATTSHPAGDPWELLRKARRANGLRTLLYLVISLILIMLNNSLFHKLDRSYKRETEYSKQVSTLIAENRRLREHCPQEPTSGSLAIR